MARTKGAVSQRVRDLEAEIQEALQEMFPDYYGNKAGRRYHPIVEMACVGANPRLPTDVRFAANKEVASYLYAKRKAVEHTGADGKDLVVQVIKFTDAQIGSMSADIVESDEVVH